MATKKTAAKTVAKKTTSSYSAAAKKYASAPRAAASPKKSTTSKTAPGKTSTVKKTTTKKSSTQKQYSAAAKKYANPKKYTGKKSTSGGKKSTGGKKGGSKFPSLQDYLMGDQYYQSGLSDLEWALEQFLTENDAAEGDVDASFDSAMQYMQLDKDKAHKYMKDDYGARGLVFSGLYPEAVSDYNEEWSMGAADLSRDLASQMRDLGFEESNMRQSTEMQKKDLRLDAIRRRSEDIQQSQFNNAARPGAKKTAKKGTAKKAPTKKSTSGKKTGTRKTGVRKLRKY